MTILRLSRSAAATALALAGLAIAAPAAGAVAPGQWETLASGPGAPGTSDDPGLHRTPDGVLHVAWVQAAGPLDQSPLERTISGGGSLLPGTSTIVSSWVDLSDAAFIDDAGGGLRVFFGGQQTTVTGAPLGVQTATGAGARRRSSRTRTASSRRQPRARVRRCWRSSRSPASPSTPASSRTFR